ncbi:hypothetical protein QFZ20_000145 [Flavobacterium sp. W4I14]|nr:hypothetical protein [Flavobacterium sp. W4I14]
MNTDFFSVDTKSAQASTELVITSSNFFVSENNKNGYGTPSEFIDYSSDMPINARPQFAGFMEELKKGTKMDYSIFVKRDRGGKEYIYPKFFYARGIKGYKIMKSDAILRLIDDYVTGKITVAVSAQDLAKVAMNG